MTTEDDYDEVEGELDDFEDAIEGDEDDDDEIGARRRRKKKAGRKRRRRVRVLPLPFDGVTLAGAGSDTLSAQADRPCKPERVILVTTAGTVYVTSIHCQGANQLAGSGKIPIEAFAYDAEAEDLPWDFAPLGTSGSMDIGITGSAAADIYGVARVKVLR